MTEEPKFFRSGQPSNPPLPDLRRPLFPPAGWAPWLTAGGFAAAHTVWGRNGGAVGGLGVGGVLVLVTLDRFLGHDHPGCRDGSGNGVLFSGAPVGPEDPVFFYLLGFFVSFLLSYFLARLSGGMGGGDVKLLAMSGLALGWAKDLLAFALAVLSGGFHGLYCWRKEAGGGIRFPSAPIWRRAFLSPMAGAKESSTGTGRSFPVRAVF